MKLIGSIIFNVFLNAFAILTADYFVEGFEWRGNFLDLLVLALAFTALNFILKPILKLLLGPFIVLSFGVLVIVVNAILLYLLDLWSPLLIINGYAPLFWGTLIIGAVNILVSFGAKRLYSK